MNKVAIVESSHAFGDALAHLVRSVPGLEIAGIAASISSAQFLAGSTEVDLWIVGLGLGNETGLDLLRSGTIPPSRSCVLAFDLTSRLRATLSELGAKVVLQTDCASELLAVLQQYAESAS